MTTQVPSPPTKNRPAFSWFGGAKPKAEEPQVLIRLRDLSQSAQAPREAKPAESESNPPAEAPPSAPSAITQPVESPEKSALAVGAERPATGSRRQREIRVKGLASAAAPSAASETVKAATDSPPPQSPAASASSPEPEQVTPARQGRSRRESQPAGRDWSHTIWQGVVGLLLVSLFVIVYFIMVGGGKRVDSANPGQKNADGSPQAADVDVPEISIPESSLSAADFAASSSAGNKPSDVATLETSADSNNSAEQDDSADGFSPPPALDSKDFTDKPAARETTGPGRPSTNYPVTPAQATYPVTDPGKYRYPDDTRPSNAAGDRGEGPSSGRPPLSGGQWNENDRLSGGRRSLPDKSPSKTR